MLRITRLLRAAAKRLLAWESRRRMNRLVSATESYLLVEGEYWRMAS